VDTVNSKTGTDLFGKPQPEYAAKARQVSCTSLSCTFFADRIDGLTVASVRHSLSTSSLISPDMRPVASLLSSAARCLPGGRPAFVPAFSMLFSSSPWAGKPRGKSELGRDAVASVFQNSAPFPVRVLGTSQNTENSQTGKSVFGNSPLCV
jgi:hypothetical protein